MGNIIQKLKAFDNYQPNRKSLWIKFMEDSKTPGLKEASKPGITMKRRILFLLSVVAGASIGLFYIVQLFILIYASPVLLVYDARPVHCSQIPFPTVAWSKRHNFKATSIKNIHKLDAIAKIDGYALDEGGVSWKPYETNVLLYATNIACASGIGGRTTTWISKDDLIDALVTDLPDTLFYSDFDVYDNYTNPLFLNKINPTLEKGVPKCKNMTKACMWNGEILEPCHPMDLQTDIGASCSFNKIPDSLVNNYASLQSAINDGNNFEDEEMKLFWKNFNIDEHLPFAKDAKIPLKRQSMSGFQYGFSFILEFDESDVACKQQNARVYYLDIKLPWDIAEMVQRAIVIPMNAEVTISLDPVITLADPNIRTVENVQRRGCVFANEMNLTHFKFYTQRYCQREALNSYINSECNCSVISFPNQPGVRLCSSGNDMYCVKEASSNFSKNHSIHSHCLPGCTGVKYNEQVESVMPYDPANPPEEVAQFLNGRKVSTSIVHVHFKNEFLPTKRYILHYPVPAVVSDVGGTVGITNGLSFIDIVRIIVAIFQIMLICIRICLLPPEVGDDDQISLHAQASHGPADNLSSSVSVPHQEDGPIRRRRGRKVKPVELLSPSRSPPTSGQDFEIQIVPDENNEGQNEQNIETVVSPFNANNL